MKEKITCIECPKGCTLWATLENSKVVEVAGNECPKGEKYAVKESEDPERILTSTVMAEGLKLKMVPVKSNRPLPKAQLLKAAEVIRDLKITTPIRAGEIVMSNILDLGIDIIATRGCAKD